MEKQIIAGSQVRCTGTWSEPGREFPFRLKDISVPEKEKDYTIRKVVPTKYGTGVRLVEIQNKKFFFKDIGREEEPIFDINKFKLIQ